MVRHFLWSIVRMLKRLCIPHHNFAAHPRISQVRHTEGSISFQFCCREKQELAKFASEPWYFVTPTFLSEDVMQLMAETVECAAHRGDVFCLFGSSNPSEHNEAEFESQTPESSQNESSCWRWHRRTCKDVLVDYSMLFLSGEHLAPGQPRFHGSRHC